MSPVCEVFEYDPDCCDLPDGTDQALIDKWQAVSTDILFAAGGYRHGLCEVTVRPCLRRCGGGFGFPWWPYKDADGAWQNFATCGCVEVCSCVELCEVVLPGPVSEIVEVLVDGGVIPEDEYRLDLVNGEYRLLRTNDDCWPSCSDPRAACDAVGSFCVTYMKGIALDNLGIAANSQLTCELVKSCLPNCPCLLPKNVAAVTRRGVAITFDTAKPWLRALPMVAAWLDSVNPNGLISGSSVWSPDLPPVRETIAPATS